MSREVDFIRKLPDPPRLSRDSHWLGEEAEGVLEGRGIRLGVTNAVSVATAAPCSVKWEASASDHAFLENELRRSFRSVWGRRQRGEQLRRAEEEHREEGIWTETDRPDRKLPLCMSTGAEAEVGAGGWVKELVEGKAGTEEKDCDRVMAGSRVLIGSGQGPWVRVDPEAKVKSEAETSDGGGDGEGARKRGEAEICLVESLKSAPKTGSKSESISEPRPTTPGSFTESNNGSEDISI